jgi:hypothetical protein
VGRGGGQIEEEGPVGGAGHVLLDEAYRLPREGDVDLLVLPARHLHALPLLVVVVLLLAVGRADDAVVFDEAVWGHVERAGDAEVPVKAEVDRPALDPRGIIHVEPRARRLARLLLRHPVERAGLARPAQPHVPLADAERRVAVISKEGRHGRPLALDERRPEAAQHPALEVRPPAVAPCEDAVAARRANR